MQVIEAQRASILVPHDHLHINHERALGRAGHPGMRGSGYVTFRSRTAESLSP
jgi:hypothetical protein